MRKVAGCHTMLGCENFQKGDSPPYWAIWYQVKNKVGADLPDWGKQGSRFLVRCVFPC